MDITKLKEQLQTKINERINLISLKEKYVNELNQIDIKTEQTLGGIIVLQGIIKDEEEAIKKNIELERIAKNQAELAKPKKIMKRIDEEEGDAANASPYEPVGVKSSKKNKNK